MQWEKLFTTERQKENINSQKSLADDLRNSFQRDYDRVIFSSSFRRMQDKTQVFPLPGPTFVHNRLTHSLEVASVGRSLANIIGQALHHKYQFTDTVQSFYLEHFPWVIATACLAHDIGNPPFGHSGEDAIRSFFKNLPPSIKEKLEQELSSEQLEDLQKFEGNSMALRILGQGESLYNSSFNLTLTSIASIVKYPSTAAEGFDKKSGIISRKKAGYFQSEKQFFERLVQTFQLPKVPNTQAVYARHPFVFITEAADDICYRIIDMEDAHRMKIIDKEVIFDLFLPFFADETEPKFRLENIQNNLNKIPSAEEQVAYIRAIWIGWMVSHCSQIFMEQEEALLAGNLQVSLLDLFPEKTKKLIQDIDTFSFNKIYQHSDAVAIELGGYTVLAVVLEELITSILNPTSSKSKKIFKLLDWENLGILKANTLYQQIMLVLDFVAGCTDTFAIDLYKKLRAIGF